METAVKVTEILPARDFYAKEVHYYVQPYLLDSGNGQFYAEELSQNPIKARTSNDWLRVHITFRLKKGINPNTGVLYYNNGIRINWL